jgi:hypothetical protein
MGRGSITYVPLLQMEVPAPSALTPGSEHLLPTGDDIEWTPGRSFPSPARFLGLARSLATIPTEPLSLQQRSNANIIPVHAWSTGIQPGVRVPPGVHKDILGVGENILRGM